jgi:VanZ family protein
MVPRPATPYFHVTRTPRRRRPTSWLLVVGTLLLILFATLGPTALPPRGVPMVDWCFTCGSQWGVDFVLNILLFVPLGLALRLAGVPVRSAVAAIVAATCAIELIQLLIPGRISSTGDLLANATGGIIGYAVAGGLRTLFVPNARQAVALAVGAGALVPAMMMLTLWLFEPAPTSHAYWGQFAPTLGQFAQFHGRVVEASVGGAPLRNGRLANGPQVRAHLRENETEVRAIVYAGAPTIALAPAVSIFDGEQNEVMLLGRDKSSLVFRLRSRARALGLRTPSVTVWNAFPREPAGVAQERVRLTGRVSGYTISATARTGATCVTRSIHFRPSHGWAYLAPFENLYTPNALRFTVLWLALLFAPLGYYAAAAVARLGGAGARVSMALLPPAVAAASLVALPPAFGLSPAASWEWQGAAIGLVCGAVLSMAIGALAHRHGRRAPQ